MDAFEEWWMLESKIPYRDKKQIAGCAWDAAMNRAEKINKVFEAGLLDKDKLEEAHI